MSEEFVQHGVILGQRPEDWVAGANTQIVYEVRNQSGDWRPYLPTKEIQFGKEDSMSCVSFSLINAIETQEKFLTGKETNYSDRWTAKRSGTTHEGNYLYKVADTVRKEGVVLDTSYPTPPNYTFDEFHAEIPTEKQAELEKEGKKWLEKWDFKYEFIPLNLQAMLDHIKQAPLQIVIPGHAIVAFLCEQDIINYFDTYNPFEKKTAFSNLQAVLKPVLTLKQPKPMYEKVVKKDGATFGVRISTPNGDQIIYATGEEQWKSWSKPDSYGLNTVNSDGSSNFTDCIQLPW